MEEIICPEPGHVRRSMEIRRAIRGLASIASWPAYLYVAVVFLLAAIMIPVTALLDIRVWNEPLADYVIYAAFPLAALVLVIEKWLTKRVAPATRSITFMRTSSDQTPNQWRFLAVAIAALISYLITGGDPITWLLNFGLWFAGAEQITEALSNSDLRPLSAGIVSISTAIILTPPVPRGNHSRAFCILLAFFVAVAEAGVAWWAWRGWKKDRVDRFDLDVI